jgi:hypothetical protein
LTRGRGGQGGQQREQIQGLEDEVARPVRPCRLELEDDAPVLGEPEPILRHGGLEQIAAELLEPLAVLSVDGDVAVQIEPVQMGVPGR